MPPTCKVNWEIQLQSYKVTSPGSASRKTEDKVHSQKVRQRHLYTLTLLGSSKGQDCHHEILLQVLCSPHLEKRLQRRLDWGSFLTYDHSKCHRRAEVLFLEPQVQVWQTPNLALVSLEGELRLLLRLLLLTARAKSQRKALPLERVTRVMADMVPEYEVVAQVD